MGFDLGSFFASGAEGLLKGVRDLISLWKLDPKVAAENAQKLAELEIAMKRAEMDFDLAMSQAQTKINEIEAASQDAFVRRARPAAIWVCVLGFAYAFVAAPFVTWISGWIATGHPGSAPILNVDVLMTALFGLLGLSTLRTYDKLKGTSR